MAMLTVNWKWITSFYLGCILFCHYVMTVNITIIGFMAQGTKVSFFYKRTHAAVDIALEKLPAILGPDVNVEYIYKYYADDCTQNHVGAVAAEMYYTRNITVFIGPGCSEATLVVGRLAASWNIPLISPGATKGSLSNKNDFKTLTRLAYNMNNFAEFYVAVLDYFQWQNIAIIHGMDYTVFPILGEGLQSALEDVDKRVFRQSFETYDENTIRRFLQKASERSRVIVLACYGEELRELMLTAQELGMTNGEYVYLYFWRYKGDSIGEKHWRRNDDRDQRAKEAYKSLLVMQLRHPKDKDFLDFDSEVKARSQRDYNFTYPDYEVNLFITAYHDAFIIYATVLKDMLAKGEDYTDGALVSSKMWNHTFPGIGGSVVINENGDRDADFEMLDLDPVTGEYVTVAEFINKTLIFPPGSTIHWPFSDDPPPDTPVCGFLGDDPSCSEKEGSSTLTVQLVLPITAAVLVALAVIFMFGYRQIKRESELNSQWWKVSWEDVSTANVGSTVGSMKQLSIETASRREGFVKDVVIYKGSTVAVTFLNATNLKIDRQALIELKQLRDVLCQNLTRFYGMCIEPPNICILNEHCSRGSLRDMLHNTSIKLDRDFKLSLMHDIAEGMNYIHNSPLSIHGRLNSDNCRIDGRFVLKLVNFGIPCIRVQELPSENFNNHDLLYIAPELLLQCPTSQGSQPGDVYSFAIVLCEMLTRTEPYEDRLEHSSLEDVLSRVKSEKELFRPTLELETDLALKGIITDCWQGPAEQRPTFRTIKKRHNKIVGRSGGHHILDTLLKRMEQYANDLEGLVEERTLAFLEEKKRSEQLLYQVLPRSVADKLRNGLSVDAEAYSSVTICFSDIVGFTAISAQSSAMQVVDLLNDLYTCFDGIIDNYDVYKVETIGDAYMVVSGLPIRNGDEHVRQIARMSLSILENIKYIKIRHLPETPLRARLGHHTGPVCAGVVGRKMPRYCLFGDTVNTASRMESNGEAMKIHISESTKIALSQFQTFRTERRGEIPVKGKGVMETFWLLGEDVDDDVFDDTDAILLP